MPSTQITNQIIQTLIHHSKSPLVQVGSRRTRSSRWIHGDIWLKPSLSLYVSYPFPQCPFSAYRTDFQHIDSGLDVKPTISCTKAHIKMTELDLANSTGSIEVDGKIVTKSQILPAFPNNDPGIEVNTYKAAIEPVWHLPGLAKRFDVSEELLRRALFEGKSYFLYLKSQRWG